MAMTAPALSSSETVTPASPPPQDGSVAPPKCRTLDWMIAGLERSAWVARVSAWPVARVTAGVRPVVVFAALPVCST